MQMEKTNNKKNNKKLLVVLISVVAVVIIALAVLLVVKFTSENKNDPQDAPKTLDEIPDAKEGDDPSNVISFKSEHYEVTNDMLNYFYRFDFYDSIDRYFDSYYQYYELDPTKDLKEQNCKMYQDKTGTWFDYFIAQSSVSIERFLLFAEAALEQGNADDPQIQENVENDMNAIKSSASEYYKIPLEEFISTRFGETVTEEEIRAALTLFYTGTIQYNKDIDSIKLNDSDLDKYYEEHKNDFLYCDFRSYQFKAKVSDDASEAEKKKAYAEAEAKADELLKMNTVEKFVEWIRNYETSINDTLEEPYTEAEINYHATKVTGEYEYNDKTAFGKWAFAGDKKEGDMTVLDNGAGVYTVYYLVKAPYRLEYNTVNFRRILVDVDDFGGDMDKTLEKANELKEKWEATDKSEDSFTALAEEYDANDTVYFEEVALSDLERDLGAWCYDKERKPGDSELVSSEYGYYLVYFCGTGRQKWKIDANEALMTERINSIFDGYTEKYPIKMNKNNLYLISGVTAYTAKEK